MDAMRRAGRAHSEFGGIRARGAANISGAWRTAVQSKGFDQDSVCKYTLRPSLRWRWSALPLLQTVRVPYGFLVTPAFQYGTAVELPRGALEGSNRDKRAKTVCHVIRLSYVWITETLAVHGDSHDTILQCNPALCEAKFIYKLHTLRFICRKRW